MGSSESAAARSASLEEARHRGHDPPYTARSSTARRIALATVFPLTQLHFELSELRDDVLSQLLLSASH